MATLIKKIKIDFTAKSMKTSSSVIKYVNGKIDFYYDPNHIVGGEYSDDCRFIADITGVQCVIRRFGSDIIVAILPSNHPAIIQLCKNAENPIESVKKVSCRDLKFSRMMKQCDRIDKLFEELYTKEGYGEFNDPFTYFDPLDWPENDDPANDVEEYNYIDEQ